MNRCPFVTWVDPDGQPATHYADESDRRVICGCGRPEGHGPAPDGSNDGHAAVTTTAGPNRLPWPLLVTW